MIFFPVTNMKVGILFLFQGADEKQKEVDFKDLVMNDSGFVMEQRLKWSLSFLPPAFLCFCKELK